MSLFVSYSLLLLALLLPPTLVTFHPLLTPTLSYFSLHLPSLCRNSLQSGKHLMIDSTKQSYQLCVYMSNVLRKGQFLKHMYYRLLSLFLHTWPSFYTCILQLPPLLYMHRHFVQGDMSDRFIWWHYTHKFTTEHYFLPDN